MQHQQIERECFELAVIYFTAIWHRDITPMESDQLAQLVQIRCADADPDNVRRIAAGCAADLDYLDDYGEDFFMQLRIDHLRYHDLEGV